MRILLTGATGFIGRHLMRRLAPPHEIIAMGRTEPPEPHDGVRWVEHDLTQSFATTRLPKEIDAVIHLAQSRHYREFPDRAADVFAVNVESTFRLLEYAREARARKFIFASTGGVYGSSDRAVSETDRLNPLNFYLSSKYSAESLVTSYSSFFDYIIFRFFFVYGPTQDRMLVPSLLQRVLNEEKITVEGEPGLRMNPIFVDDATSVFEPALALDRSDLFNVAGDEIATISDLIDVMERVAGKRAVVEHTAAGALGDLIGDNSRMKRVLRVQPQTALEAGLRRMVESELSSSLASKEGHLDA
jgi:UDP-glucose 4-epimerase